MLFLSYAYRFLSNFVFLALVYFALNLLDKYQHRVVVAILVLVYAGMHAASALRSFHFFQRIERLEGEAPRLAATSGEGPNATTARRTPSVVSPAPSCTRRSPAPRRSC